ncbi:interferon-inducible GTPase 5 [Bombina bombina]|uniref:interferon-inducible GTPase 5 n=1 Tax=Bombina bombina TaxID=8345 RepID=UPI00235AD2C9|nr:interferon-inducible GTPase 5 [Bombina bombina]
MESFSELSLSAGDLQFEEQHETFVNKDLSLSVIEQSFEFSVAIAGGPGVGKTVLIQALLGLNDSNQHSRAASLHPNKPQSPLLYLHPSHPGLTLWELPLEEGSPEKWISEADLLILVTDGQFSPAYSVLTHCALSLGKKLCFVRTKVDCDLHTLKRRMREAYRREEVLLTLRNVILQPLSDITVKESLPLFLVSGYEPSVLDTQRLKAEVTEAAKECGRFLSLAQQGFEVIGDEEIAELQSALERGGIPEMVRFIQSSLDSLLDTHINIALMGGNPDIRHSLLNSLRGIKDGDDGAAHGEDPENPIEYPSLKYPMASWWDLPGLGILEPQPQKYLENIHISRYDLILLLWAPEHEGKNNEALLVKELKKHSRKVFIIHQCETERKEKPKIPGVGDDEVFTLSPTHLPGPEFHRFLKSLEKQLSSPKTRAFVLSLPNLSSEVIQKKQEALSQEVWKVALLSSLVASVPVPGLAIACDMSLLTARLDTYRQELGLDANSISCLSHKSGVPIATLMLEVHSPAGKGVTRELVGKMLCSATGLGLEVAGVFLHRIPFVGPLAAGGIAFHASYVVLSRCLQGMSEDAQRVLQRAQSST